MANKSKTKTVTYEAHRRIGNMSLAISDNLDLWESSGFSLKSVKVIDKSKIKFVYNRPSVRTLKLSIKRAGKDLEDDFKQLSKDSSQASINNCENRYCKVMDIILDELNGR